MASLSTCDPNNIFDTIDDVVEAGIRACSLVCTNPFVSCGHRFCPGFGAVYRVVACSARFLLSLSVWCGWFARYAFRLLHLAVCECSTCWMWLLFVSADFIALLVGEILGPQVSTISLSGELRVCQVRSLAHCYFVETSLVSGRTTRSQGNAPNVSEWLRVPLAVLNSVCARTQTP
jgi:hypothetical protein